MKPHIWKYRGEWCCKRLTGHYEGWGLTPKAAYESWQHTIRQLT